MEQETFEMHDRMVSVMFPQTYDEYRDALEAGHQVATTDDQRKAWGLKPFGHLPVLTPDEAIALLFAAPDDPGLALYDEGVAPNPDNFDDEGTFVGVEEAGESLVDLKLTVDRRAVGKRAAAAGAAAPDAAGGAGAPATP